MSTYRKNVLLCTTKFCRKFATKKGGGKCSKCKMREWRARQPVKARLGWLRSRATRKGCAFDLDAIWLAKFLEDSGYDPKLHHIDRVCVLGGYTKGNLQVLPFADNIAKGNRERRGQAHLF